MATDHSDDDFTVLDDRCATVDSPTFNVRCPSCGALCEAVWTISDHHAEYETGSNVTQVHATLVLHAHNHECPTTMAIHAEMLERFNNGLL